MFSGGTFLTIWKRNVWISIAILLIFGVLFVAKNITDYNDMNSIVYNSRVYHKSNSEINDTDRTIIEKTVDTGMNIKGMEVYDPTNNTSTSTVIYLKDEEGNFLVYSLSGGP